VVLIVGSVLVLASLFLPWWVLTAATTDGSPTEFRFWLSPLGVGVEAGGLDLATIAGPEVSGYLLLVTLLFFPIWGPLAVSGLGGLLQVAFDHRSNRQLTSPLWAVTALFWWFFLLLLIFGLLSDVGLTMGATGSADISFGELSLGSATWGWAVGLWVALAGVSLQIIGAVVTMAHTRYALGRIPENERPTMVRKVSAGTVLYVLTAVLQVVGWFVMRSFTASLGLDLPVLNYLLIPPAILILTAFLSRKEVWEPRRWPAPVFPPPLRAPGAAQATVPPPAAPPPQGGFCPNCGGRNPSGSRFCQFCGAGQ
jgi:hypothetical protein